MNIDGNYNFITNCIFKNGLLLGCAWPGIIFVTGFFSEPQGTNLISGCTFQNSHISFGAIFIVMCMAASQTVYSKD